MPDALEGLSLLLSAGGGNVLPVEFWTPHFPDEPPTTLWPRNDSRHLQQLVAHHEPEWSAELLCGFPRSRPGHHEAIAGGPVSWPGAMPLPLLWTRTENKDSARRLERFRPAPSLLLREGDTVRHIAFWLVRRPLTWSQLERANKRIAHNVGAPKKYADPDTFTFPLPGTFLRRGRTRPVPVTVESMSLETHTAKAIVGRLKDAPDPDAWRK